MGVEAGCFRLLARNLAVHTKHVVPCSSCTTPNTHQNTLYKHVQAEIAQLQAEMEAAEAEIADVDAQLSRIAQLSEAQAKVSG